VPGANKPHPVGWVIRAARRILAFRRRFEVRARGNRRLRRTSPGSHLTGLSLRQPPLLDATCLSVASSRDSALSAAQGFAAQGVDKRALTDVVIGGTLNRGGKVLIGVEHGDLSFEVVKGATTTGNVQGVE
jgi:hypothetical protein